MYIVARVIMVTELWPAAAMTTSVQQLQLGEKVA